MNPSRRAESSANQANKVSLTRGIGALASVLAAGCIGGEPGALVPPTADQDPRLPSTSIEFQGAPRRIHYREFGDARSSVLFVIPGSGSDVRAYLPLQSLA